MAHYREKRRENEPHIKKPSEGSRKENLRTKGEGNNHGSKATNLQGQ